MTRKIKLTGPTLFDGHDAVPNITMPTCGRCGGPHVGQFFTRVAAQWIGQACLTTADIAPDEPPGPLGPSAVPMAWITTPSRCQEDLPEVS